MNRFLAGTMWLALAVTSVASAMQETDADLEKSKAQRAAVVEQLTTNGTADALAAAALLKQIGSEDDSGAYALAARAVALAPDRRDLAWLAVRLCNISADCDAARPEQHLRSADPGNGVGFMTDLARAQAKNDAAAVSAALTAIGNSERVFVYFNPLVAATVPELATASHPGSARLSRRDLAEATIEMIGVVAASVLPPTQAFSSSCKGMALQLEGRLELCRRAARALERADTFIGEGLGLSLEQRLWPLDSPEGRAITARRRVFQYRLEAYSRLNISSSNPFTYPAGVADVLRAHDREQDAALVYLRKGGVPIDPPQKWVSRQLPRVP
jgi:hypothetical protein